MADDLTAPGSLTRAGLVACAAAINGRLAAIEQHARSALSNAVEVGRMLTEAKAALGHGAWLPWLDAHVECSRRTAQAYMQVAKWADDEANAQRVAHLTLGDALRLLANPRDPSAGDPVCVALEQANDLLREVAESLSQREPVSDEREAAELARLIRNATECARVARALKLDAERALGGALKLMNV